MDTCIEQINGPACPTVITYPPSPPRVPYTPQPTGPGPYATGPCDGIEFCVKPEATATPIIDRSVDTCGTPYQTLDAVCDAPAAEVAVQPRDVKLAYTGAQTVVEAAGGFLLLLVGILAVRWSSRRKRLVAELRWSGDLDGCSICTSRLVTDGVAQWCPENRRHDA